MPTPPDPSAATVATTLGEDIIFGRLAPGARLVEDPLMARFGATRHAVRQALAHETGKGRVVSGAAADHQGDGAGRAAGVADHASGDTLDPAAVGGNKALDHFVSEG